VVVAAAAAARVTSKKLQQHWLTARRYGYVRSFEQPDSLLANTWIVVRIDGRGFSKYVDSIPHLHLIHHFTTCPFSEFTISKTQILITCTAIA
jgi:hypothetical protein